MGWLSFWAAFGFLDAVVEPSLSDTTRRTFRTDTALGDVVFTTALSFGAYFLRRHIKYGGK